MVHAHINKNAKIYPLIGFIVKVLHSQFKS